MIKSHVLYRLSYGLPRTGGLRVSPADGKPGEARLCRNAQANTRPRRPTGGGGPGARRVCPNFSQLHYRKDVLSDIPLPVCPRRD